MVMQLITVDAPDIDGYYEVQYANAYKGWVVTRYHNVFKYGGQCSMEYEHETVFSFIIEALEWCLADYDELIEEIGYD